jgi:glycosyltransferase involved in cell wall biosynthesis
VTPAYNEERRLRSTLVDYASRFPGEHVLVALNGCTDGTLALVESVARDHPNVQFIEIPQRVGKGGALRAASLLCDTPYVAFVDADGSTSAAECARLFDVLRTSSASGVIGSRWLDPRTVGTAQPLARRIASRCFNGLVRLLFRIDFRDTQCGIKIFRRKDLLEVLPRVETAGFAFDVDLIVQFARNGKRLIEEPTVWADVPGSKVQLVKSALKVGTSVLRLRLSQSLLSMVVPLLDHFFPTAPMKQHEKMAILVLNWRDTKHPRAGGAEKYLHEVAKIWVRDGHYVEWLTSSFANAPKHETVDGVHVTRVRNRFTVYACAALEYVRSMRGRFDAIVDAENGIPFFSPFYSIKPRLLLMFHVHRDVFMRHLPWPLSHLFTAIESKFMPFVYGGASLVTISDDTRVEMQRAGITNVPIPVAHPGVDESLEPGPKAPEPTICYVGRLERYKRVDLLLRAMPKILAKDPRTRLVVAGSGTDAARLIRLAASLGIAHAVDFRGHVSEAEKRSIFQQAWVCGIPSSKEGWCITAVEANACGTPVVAYDVDGLRSAVPQGEGALLLPEGGDFADGLCTLLEDDLQRASLSAAAVANAGRCTWQNTAHELMRVIQFAAARSGYGLFVTEAGLYLVGADSRSTA